MIKTREFPENNYRGIYHNGKTIRVALNPKKSISELKYPEFYDVKITNVCDGCCPWCYQDSHSWGMHADDILSKISDFFGSMDENQRPFQVAIGGGEPTLHPEFIDILKTFYDLGITPNYTTNGMFLSNNVLEATRKYCGGAALSVHPHLKKYWQKAVIVFSNYGIKLNFHHIISDKDSTDNFLELYNEYKDRVDYFVLLPYVAAGRAEEKEINFIYLFDKLDKMDRSKIAFGANFYEHLKSKKKWDISLYQPEILSKYINMIDMSIHRSSFDS